MTFQPPPPGEQPPQQPQQPYGAPPPPQPQPAQPWSPPPGGHAPPPQQPPQYGAPPPQQPPQYGAPPPQQPQYGAPVPPPGQYGPPPGQYGAPPPGQYGAPVPPGRSAGFDVKAIHPLDWAILGCGFLVLILSFFGFYTGTISSPGFSYSNSVSAWHEIFGGGFFGWIAMVFGVAGTVAMAIALFAPHVKLPISARLACFAGFAIGALCELLAIFIHPTFASGSGFGYHYSVGHGFAFWLSLLLLLGGTVLSLMRLQASSDQLPGALNKLPKIG